MLPLKRVPSLQGLVLLSAPVVVSAASESSHNDQRNSHQYETGMSQAAEASYAGERSPLPVNEGHRYREAGGGNHSSFGTNAARQSLYRRDLEKTTAAESGEREAHGASAEMFQRSQSSLEERFAAASMGAYSSRERRGDGTASSTTSTSDDQATTNNNAPRGGTYNSYSEQNDFRLAADENASSNLLFFGGNSGDEILGGAATMARSRDQLARPQSVPSSFARPFGFLGAQQPQQQQQQNDARQYKTRLCVYLSTPGGCPRGARCFFAHGISELRPFVSGGSAASSSSGKSETREHNNNGRAAASALENGQQQQQQQREYKTKPCRYTFADCPFAALGRCQFAHSAEELRASLSTSSSSGNNAINSSPMVSNGRGLQQPPPPPPPPQNGAFFPGQQIGAPVVFNNGDSRSAPPPPPPVLLSPSPARHHALQRGTEDENNIPHSMHHQHQAAAQAQQQANHARRFKTRLCKYHIAGHCPYAATNTCQFAHSEDELRVPPQRTWRPSALETWYNNTNGQTHHNDNDGQTTPPLQGSSKTYASPGSSNGGGSMNGAIMNGGGHHNTHHNNHHPHHQDPSLRHPQQHHHPSHQHHHHLQQQQQQQQQQNGQHQSGAALRAALEQKRFTKLCKYFLAGHCPFAASGTCQFAHSASELRRRSPPPIGAQQQQHHQHQQQPHVAQATGATGLAMRSSPPRSLQRKAEPYVPIQESAPSAPARLPSSGSQLALDVVRAGLSDAGSPLHKSIPMSTGGADVNLDVWPGFGNLGPSLHPSLGRLQPDWSFRAEDVTLPAGLS